MSRMGQPKWYRQQILAEAAARRDVFAEHMANGHTITSAAKLMGVTVQRGSQYWQKIKAEMGWLG